MSENQCNLIVVCLTKEPDVWDRDYGGLRIPSSLPLPSVRGMKTASSRGTLDGVNVC